MHFRKLLRAVVFAFMFLTSAFVSAGDEAERLDPNSASSEELGGLPFLDEADVETIIEARPYASIGDLDAVLSASLDQDQLNELYAHLFVPIHLNKSSEADILLIPGVGKRMAHEFEEYRPYKSIEQFRREMSKYVDDDEVARLESYVTLD
jgi:DNA uptake protein ComE-like DNA-binding protein